MREGERREGERREGREGERGGMTVIHIILMAPYIQTNNEELYLYNNVHSSIRSSAIPATPDDGTYLTSRIT